MDRGKNNTGWIKLHRQTAEHGHFQMPGICFKLWMYCLLKAHPSSEAQEAAGTLLLTYAEIQDKLRQPGRAFSKSTIAAALRYLQEQGYLQIARTQHGLKITVVNWFKYQEENLEDEPDCELREESQLSCTPTVPEDDSQSTVAVPQTTAASTATVHQELSSTQAVPLEQPASTPRVLEKATSGTPAVQLDQAPVLRQYHSGTLGVQLEGSRSTPSVPLSSPQPSKDVVYETSKNCLKNYLKNDLKNYKELKDRCITPQTPLAGEPATMEEVFQLFPRYNVSQQEILREYWQNIGLTFKGDRLSLASVSQYMNQWERYPVDIVLEAMLLHLQRYPHKRLTYTAGIMRRLAGEQSINKPDKHKGGVCDRQTGSSPNTHPIYGAPSRFAHLLR